MKIKNEASTLLGIFLDELGLHYQREFHFEPTRKWAADFYVPSHKLLIELEGGAGYFLNPKGGLVLGGRHNKKEGFEDDIRKYNHAQLYKNLKVIRFTTGMVINGEAKVVLEAWLKNGICVE